jgi:hypothetical protein
MGGISGKVNIAAMPYSFTGYSIFLASEKGYFKKQGLDVTLKASYPNGKATLIAVVMDAHYQLPLASTYIGSLITAGNIVSELIRIFKTTFNILKFWQIHVLCKNPLGTSLVNW